MSEASVASQASIRVNGETEPLAAATLAALLADKAVDTEQKGIAVALNGAVVPRAAWPETALKAGDNVEIVRARQEVRADPENPARPREGGTQLHPTDSRLRE